ncbi:uncharacterized protein LOC115574956, partial [Scomber scombrus]
QVLHVLHHQDPKTHTLLSRHPHCLAGNGIQTTGSVADPTRPSPGARRDVVKVAVDQMLEDDPNPTRAVCQSIGRSIVRDYTNIFADVGKKGDIIGDGCHSLPAEATLDEMKRQLCNIYSEEGMDGAERADLLMEGYRHLNSVPEPAIVDMKEERGLYSHSGLLTDVYILNKLQEALNNKGSTVICFCQEHSRRPGIQEVLNNYEPPTSDQAACVLMLLVASFREPNNAIMLENDVSCLKDKKASCDFIRFTFTL